MSHARVSVVKVGGSLLATPKFPQRMRAWLADRTSPHRDTHFVLVAGGGKWVDAIRELVAHTPMGDERAHWICVDLMDVTAGLVAAMLPEIYVTPSFGDLEHRLREPGVTLLKPREFLARIEPARIGTRLPADWSVTSDSIAARLAVVLGADELILIKSAPPPISDRHDGWLARLAAVEYVDTFLPMLSDELPPLEFSRLSPPPQRV